MAKKRTIQWFPLGCIIFLMWRIPAAYTAELPASQDPNQNQSHTISAAEFAMSSLTGGFSTLMSTTTDFISQSEDVLLAAAETAEPLRKAKTDLEKLYGISLGITLDYHHHQILDGSVAKEGRGLFWWNVTLEKNLWEGAKLISKARGSSMDGEPPHGITPLVGSRLNIDWSAYETEMIYLANLYIEQRLYEDRLLLAVGKLTFPAYFDTNKVAGWDFFAHSLARNQEFPHVYHTVGGLARYNLTDSLYVQLGLTDKGRRSETGLNTFFDDESKFQTLFECGVKQKFGGREGNYRLNIWQDYEPLTRFDGRGKESGTIGMGLNFDQMLTDRMGAFFRYGTDDGRVRKFSHYWSPGFTYKGLLPNRKDDVFGLGVGQGITSHDFRKAQNATSTETIMEAYYKMVLTKWASLTFDFQTLWNPGTNSHNDTACLGGVRLLITF